MPLRASGGEVAPVFFQRLVFALGILVGHALRAAHLLERLHELRAGDAGLVQDARRGDVRVAEREEVMLGAEVFVLELAHLAFGGVERHW